MLLLRKFTTDNIHMNETDLVQQLHSSGLRLTPQRLVILQVLDDHEGHITPTEIYQLSRKLLPGMTEATVYRTLDFLCGHGLALLAHVGSGRMVYESARHNHHHLICRKCGKTLNVEQAVIQPLYEQFIESTGFHVDSSHVTFFGMCADCYKTDATNS